MSHSLYLVLQGKPDVTGRLDRDSVPALRASAERIVHELQQTKPTIYTGFTAVQTATAALLARRLSVKPQHIVRDAFFSRDEVKNTPRLSAPEELERIAEELNLMRDGYHGVVIDMPSTVHARAIQPGYATLFTKLQATTRPAVVIMNKEGIEAALAALEPKLLSETPADLIPTTRRLKFPYGGIVPVPSIASVVYGRQQPVHL